MVSPYQSYGAPWPPRLRDPCWDKSFPKDSGPDKAFFEIGYDQLDHWMGSLQPQLINQAFACIVGILRGGAPLALMASHLTGVQVCFLRYERSTRQVTWDSTLARPQRGEKVLLCEDIAGCGHTFTDCISFLSDHGLKVQTLAAVFDDISRIRPDYAMDARGGIAIFPWERQAYTRRYKSQWSEALLGKRRAVDADHVFDCYATDLDGILLADVAADLYRQNLEAALSLRDQLPPLVPPFHVSKAIAIITGRPLADRDRTASWLKQHGYETAELIMRDPTQYGDSTSEVARYKARAARRLGCTHFIESDPVQAMFIAQSAPLLKVIWWDAGSRSGRIVMAHQWYE